MKGLLKMMSEELEGKKVLKGKVSEELRVQARANKDSKVALEEEIDQKMESFVQTLKAEYSDQMESLEREHDELWDKITAELELDPDESYSMDLTTGKVHGRE